MPDKDPKDGWITLPPNPLYKREYVASCDHGHVTISIPAPGGQLPYGVDAEEIISFMQLIIRQLNRSIQSHAESADHEGESSHAE